jgi:predicted TIM-barrel fold metal-dependent hydrolase
MLRAIDGHVHLYPPEVSRDPAGWAAANGEGRWAALCLRRRRDGRAVQTFPSAGGLLAAMDAAEIERAVLLGWYWERPASCLLQNRFHADCVRRHPDRLAAFAAMHPGLGVEGVEAEMGRARGEGLAGLGELSPHSVGHGLDDPAFGAALERAAEFGWPVTLHAADPEGRPYPGRVATPLGDFIALARRYPGTRFILAHWGGLLPLRLPDEELPPNLFYDTAASPLEHTAAVWKEMTDAVGPDKVVFGSDFPLNLYPKLDAEPNLARFAAEARGALGGAALAAVLRGNLECLLGKGRPPSVFHA